MKKLFPILKKSQINIPKNSFGILSRYTDKKQKEQFDKQIEYFTSKNVFTLVDYKQYVIDTINEQKKSFFRRMFSKDEKTDSEMVEQRKILNAIFEEELLDFRKLDKSKKLKEEIAATVGCTLDRVDTLLENFKHTFYLHNWLQKLKKNNKPIPSNEEELMMRFRKERTIPYQDKIEMKKNNRKARESYMKEYSLEKLQEKIDSAKMKKRAQYKIIKHHKY
jgi:hypothetical protein